MTRSSIKELFLLLENPERVFRLRRKLFETPRLVESNSPEFDQFSDIEEHIEEEVIEIMAEIMEQYMSKTRSEYGSGVARPKIDANAQFELKGKFLKELRDNTFSGSEHEDANKHIEKVLEIVDLFHIPNITQDQLMLRAFPVSLSGVASRWLRNEPAGSITTWDVLKMKFRSIYCPPTRTAKKMEEINNFQQEPDESLFRAWERFKELSLTQKVPYLLKPLLMLKWPSMKWLNTLRNGTTETSDGLAAIQAQLNNLGREIKKVNKKVYAAQVECEQCKGPHYTKDFPLKEEGKTLEEAYYTQFDEQSIARKRIRKSAQLYENKPERPRKSISTAKANLSEIRRMGSEVRGVKILEAYDHTLPQKEKDPGSFTLSCFINNTCFDKALVDLGASVSVMPFSTYTNLGLGILSHTRLTIELADRTIKQPRGIAKNMLVRIGKFIFPIDFIILDIPEDDDVPLILRRPFLSNAHAKIDVFKRKVTLRVGEEKLVFKSVNPATSMIKRVFILKSFDSETELVGEGESFDPIYGFIIIDGNDVTRDVVLAMPFFKKFMTCQTIMEKFAHENKCKRIMNK
ncbi:hypothetical protein Tco_1147137 [Tanacetum coccineum]